MAINKTRYVDLEALRLFKDKIVNEIENGDASVKEYVTEVFNSTQVVKPLYYSLDGHGDRIPVYEEAEGTAEASVTYYTRTGTGSNSNPYVYEVAVPQPEAGTELDPGMYFQTGEFETTFADTGDPVIDEETGEPETDVATILDGVGEITDADIKDLFEEEP